MTFTDGVFSQLPVCVVSTGRTDLITSDPIAVKPTMRNPSVDGVTIDVFQGDAAAHTICPAQSPCLTRLVCYHPY